MRSHNKWAGTRSKGPGIHSPSVFIKKGTIFEDIVRALEKIFSLRHFKLWSSLFPYNEERIEQPDTVQPVQIPTSLRYKFCYLTKNVLALIHVCLNLWVQANLTILKGRQGI